ncbi:MAG: TonB-dependent receptor [Mediterranea sp.]|nr:TonB-dependent receptor [Mediterranea sp.]
MKKTCLVGGLLLLCVCSHRVDAQEQALASQMTIEVKNVPVRTALEKIRQSAGLHFVYEEEAISRSLRVSLSYPKPTATDIVLDDLCRQASLKHERQGGAILLYPLRRTSFELHVTLSDKESREPLMMATCVLKPLGAYAATDASGKATLHNIPAGRYTLDISYVGYEPVHRSVLVVGTDVDLRIPMQPSSLALKEVVVVARQNVAGESTGSIIGRQAIDHLQAMSLDDVMQLVPGALMKNTDLTSQSNVQIRTLVNNNTNAFGASVVMDGVPMSNNGTLSQGGFSNTAFVGTDLRNISADDIESVEVVRGIPSAEYGDLTSGLVVVHSKVGETPWQAKAKINPGTMNYSLGKGLRLKHAGILNFNLDYAKAWGDPRQKTKSFNRYTLSAGYGYDFSHKWHTTTKLRYVLAKDWNGNDPDAIDDGTYTRNNNSMFSLTHNGKVALNRLLARTLTYTLGLSFTDTQMKKTAIVPNSSGLLPILTATQSGYYTVPFEQASYEASGGSVSKPGSVYAKLTNAFFVKGGPTYQNFKMGLEYHYDWNHARGYYNVDERYPLRPNNSGRPRPFYDIPGVHQMAAYVEDNFRWELAEHRSLRIQLGARFTALQPWADEATFALSPRINASFAANKWLNIRGGFGLNSKTPGLDYLYPDKKYTDRVAANYMPQDDKAAQLLLYHTQVYDTQRTRGLKNATNRRLELGFDIKLPHGRKLSFIGYHDRTANGFGNATEYYTYEADFFSQQQGLIITPGAATQVDWNNPARRDIVFATTGKIGNTNVSINKGVEMDCDLGEIPAIHTSFYLTGAYQQTQTYSKDLNASDPVDLPTEYAVANTTPFKIVYPSSLQKSTYRRFMNTLRVVTNIPALRMVASFAGQAVWYNYSFSDNPPMDPIGWIDTDLTYHDITPAMLADKDYTIKGVSLQSQRKNPRDNVPTKAPITWLISGRLTKELGNVGGLSFYANNLLFYEPYRSSSTSTTLTQRNTGSFSFGVELFFNF